LKPLFFEWKNIIAQDGFQLQNNCWQNDLFSFPILLIFKCVNFCKNHAFA